MRIALLAGLAALLSTLVRVHASTDPLQTQFMNPPAAARPWVVGYWLDGNITKAGITRDLEAMAQSGIGGFSFMDCGLGNPPGPYRFMSDSWRDLFRFMLSEAARVGLEVDLNDGPGWAGSGGPWIKPEQAAQRVIIAETVVEGPAHFSALLPKPDGVANNFYRDIAVLAYPAATGRPTYRIPGYDSTKSFSGIRDFAGVVPWPRFLATQASWPAVPANQCLKAAEWVDVSPKLTGDQLTWDVPPGRWIVLRCGHTVANGGIRAGQPEAQGLECDKLSTAGIDAQFAGMVGRLATEAGDLTGRTLASTHIDSWESGSGNWTDDLRAQFRRRRGYDLMPYVPTLNGVVVDSREVSERFLWDFRETIAELVLENYAGRLRTLARAQGMRLSIEAYDGTVDDLRYAGRADEPMGEFWQRPIYSGSPMCDIAEEMASAAHVYGRNIVGAEAFTAIRGDFLDHPAVLKPMADWAFCAGINKLFLSEWVMQPWPRLAPGVSFHEFGTVFHESLTWWPLAKPWFEYLARCQLMLRQGRPVADICYLAAEGAPSRFTPPVPATARGLVPTRPEYNFDGCPAELILDPATRVEGGSIVLPSGMQYRLLVLPTYNAGGEPVMRVSDDQDYHYAASAQPKVETMTPQLLRRVKELVEAGATILGTRPTNSPSLSGYPQCDAAVTLLADELWGPKQGDAGAGEHLVGRGRVVWGKTPEEILRHAAVPADFACAPALAGKVNYTHRREQHGRDIYFLVNKADHPVAGEVQLRASASSVALWWPETGSVAPAPFAAETGGVTRLQVSLQARQSLFVVLTPTAAAPEAVRYRDMALNGRSVKTAAVPDDASIAADRGFVLAAWAKPLGRIEIPTAVAGGWEYRQSTAKIPGAGYQTYLTQGAGRRGFSVGSNGVVVFQYGTGQQVEPLLAYSKSMIPAGQQPIDFGNGIADADIPSVLVAVVYAQGVPRLYLNGKLAMTGPQNRFHDDVPTTSDDERPFVGDLAAVDEFEALQGAQKSRADTAVLNFSTGEIGRSGHYVLNRSDGSRRELNVSLPPVQELPGPWDVAFPGPHPLGVRFQRLEDWSKREEPAIKYYAGVATYRTVFAVAATKPPPGTRLYLDLGDVAVIASATLNGRAVGAAWTAPYRLDITDAVQWTGENRLEIRVANLWVNRLIGDASLPPDAEYTASGALKAWPDWLRLGKPQPTGRRSFTTRILWRRGDPLVKSGLLGPVRLVAVERLP